MLFKQKEILFNKFLEKWGDSFAKVPFIIEYLQSYDEIKELIRTEAFVHKDDLYTCQLEWLSLVAQQTNSIDKIFFRESFIPIGKYDYDYFLDISSEPFAIFTAEYHPFFPHFWFKEFVCRDLVDLFSKLQRKIDIKKQSNYSLKKRLLNQIEATKSPSTYDSEPFTYEDLFYNGEPVIIRKANTVYVKNTNNEILRLMPLDTNVEVIEGIDDDDYKLAIKTLQDLILVIIYFWYEDTNPYKLKIYNKPNSFITFEDGLFVFKDSDKKAIDEFFKNFTKIKNAYYGS